MVKYNFIFLIFIVVLFICVGLVTAAKPIIRLEPKGNGTGGSIVDTNATTACELGEVLLGNGSCMDTARFVETDGAWGANFSYISEGCPEGFAMASIDGEELVCVNISAYTANGTTSSYNYVANESNTSQFIPMLGTDEGKLRIKIDNAYQESNISYQYVANESDSSNFIPSLATSEGILKLNVVSIVSDIWEIINGIIYTKEDYPVAISKNLSANNINISGCVVYNGGTLGTCV